MLVLAIDTSSVVATCALWEEGRLVNERVSNSKMTHSQTLMPMIEEMMRESELEIESVDYFAVVTGPGSFTGLRIGVATAKALAHALGKSVVGIPAMEALAYNLPYVDGIIVPIMDARRDRVFTAIYRWENNKLEIVMDQDVMQIDDLIERLKSEDIVYFCGDGSIKFRDRFESGIDGKAVFARAYVNMPKASSVAEVAADRIKEGKIQTHLELVPNYLRKSQAEREYDEKHGN
ncbi:MAG: tRNA (adenosine(37)-N6)-threonylcarbamoyltransferase complex dimerization subunit type 1 TsaB [Tissierellales bacterium]|jgi:tRNA threonylcarbamoyladenosine biosynthesis protein TsaB|nr:tRNA (adenosine(37)-N6)-threonylcarbamoyltransferase complex dimerization subunit type 1 TsaB [Tissierellales bacterium]